MYNFRELKTSDLQYKKVKNEYRDFLDSYKAFATHLTELQGKSKSGKSGKADSYTRYLIRLYIFAKEHVMDDLMRLDSLSFYNELQYLQSSPEFKSYNEYENRFPNASISCFYQFWLSLAFEEDDLVNNHKTNLVAKDEVFSKENLVFEPKSKTKKVKLNGKYVYLRSNYLRNSAKKRSEWLCEYDKNHITFTSKDNCLPFIEAHHLIPISLQDNFEFSLDVVSNIVCLCPNCHRMIHHSINSEREIILKKIYDDRNQELRESKIWISYSDFLFLYGIKLSE